ncbi:MAG: hypothetical protein ACYC0V_06235 [Armatimonadota bacterium]
MKNRIAKYLIAAVLCACVISSAAFSGSLTYNNQRKLIRAGVISFAPNALPAFPYMFYIMDQRLDLKPAGWEFLNPMALTNNKAAASYWEVSINVPFEDIAKFDVLYLGAPVGTNLIFNREQKEKLRKFVDGGGVLWIENKGAGFNGTIDFDTFFINGIDFGALGARPSRGRTPAHPLLARPFTLTWQDINNLGNSGRSGSTVTNGGANGLPNDRYFSTIISDNGGKSLVSGAQYGSGHIVISGEPVGQAISVPVGESAPGFCNTGNMIAANPEDMKFAYNIVNWGSEYTTFHKDPRHTGSSFAEVGAPLAKLWEFKSAVSGNPVYTSPVILDDMVMFIDGGGILHCFDLSPNRDRNMDGNADDGIADQPGSPYDELWSSNVGVGSSLTCAYVPLGGAAIPGVAVVRLNGEVIGFDASSNNPAPLTLFQAHALTSFVGTTSAPSLTYSDGGLYIGDGNGSLHGINFFNSLIDWVAPKISIASMGPAVGSPTVGYIYDRVSGAMDQVVYLPRQGIGGLTPAPGGIQVYPVKIYNEVLTGDAAGTGWVPLISRRSLGSSIMAGRWNLYIPNDVTGIPISINGSARLSAQPGTFEVDMDSLAALGLLGKPILADYEIDANGAAYNPRSTIMIKTNPSVIDQSRNGVSCTPALSPDDVLYFGTDNGSLYAVQESSDPDPRRGAMVRAEVRWRSALTDPAILNLLGGTTAAPPVLTGSPCVGDDMSYFAINNPGGQGYLMAYKSSPLMEINVGVPIQPGSTIEFLQTDSMTPGVEPTRIVYNPADRITRDWIDVNYVAGKIMIRNMRPSGAPQRDLSTTQDIAVTFVRARMAGGDGTTRESQVHYAFPQINTTTGRYYRTNTDDKWNNLLWCVKLPSSASSSPMLYGSKLYVGMNNGSLASVDVNKMKNAAAKLDINSPGTATTLANNLGIMLMWDPKTGYMWDTPINPTALAPIYATPAGSNGVMAVATPTGLTVLYNSVTLVADGNRIVEVDAGGEILWTCDATTAITETSTTDVNVIASSASSVPFNRPAVARRTEIGGIVVADTGNNRIVLVDQGGRVVWEIKNFTDAYNIMATGMPLNLSKPQDVTAWMQWDQVSGTPEYHFLIADSGNFRVIDVMAKWDDTALEYKNVLGWVSRSALEGKQYLYTSARLMPDANNMNQWVIMGIVSSQQVALTGAESPGGALVKLLYDPANSRVGDIISNPYTQLPIDINNPALTWQLQNPRFFTRVYDSATPGALEYTDVVLDATGIHVVLYNSTGQAIRNFTPQDYENAVGKPLSPSYAQILPNGNILVTNKAIGAANAGEVFELGWNSTSGSYDIVWPAASVFFGSNSFGLRQPSSAERQVY